MLGEVDSQAYQKYEYKCNGLCELNRKVGATLYYHVVIADSQRAIVRDAMATSYKIATDFGDAVHQRYNQRVGLQKQFFPFTINQSKDNSSCKQSDYPTETGDSGGQNVLTESTGKHGIHFGTAQYHCDV